jgi:hypothetical protein
MRLTIKDREGKAVYVAVAKTSRGFNQKQKREIAKVRKQLAGRYSFTPPRANATSLEISYNLLLNHINSLK